MKVKENKGVSLTGFVITILVILLIIFVGGCVYLLNNPVKENVETQNVTSTQTASNDNIVNENESKGDTAIVQKKVMTADEKFEVYVKNLKATMLKYNEEEIEGKEYREYIIDGKDSNDENYTITLSGNGILKLDDKEVANNVIGFNAVYTGNGGYKNLYFIKEDGSVAYAAIDETEYLSNGKIKTTDVKGLKNIISIMGGVSATYEYPGACYGYAIDIEGNMFEI